MSFCVMLGIIHAGTIAGMVSYIAYKEASSLVAMQFLRKTHLLFT